MMDKQEKLYALYDAAIRIFAKYGYKKTTVEDIAAELGMTKGNIYLYAENKQDLYNQSLAYALKKWQGYAVSAMEEENDVISKIITYTNKGYEYLCVNTNLRTIIINDPSVFPLSSGEDKFHHINLESMEILSGLIREGIAKGVFRDIDVQAAAELLYSVYVMFIIKTYVKSELTQPDTLMTASLDLLMHGLIKKKNK